MVGFAKLRNARLAADRWTGKRSDLPKIVGASEAKAHLPRLLKEVAAGETITITRHGIVVALLVPPALGHQPNVDEVIDEILRFGETERIRLGGVKVRELVEGGRL
jgi:prevent-host-death family protein